MRESGHAKKSGRENQLVKVSKLSRQLSPSALEGSLYSGLLCKWEAGTGPTPRRMAPETTDLRRVSNP